MCDFKRRVFQALGVHRIGMVLLGDLDFVSCEIFDWMIAAAVTEFQLVDLCTVGQGQDLMPQTDAENRKHTAKLTNGIDYLANVLRIAGTVA